MTKRTAYLAAVAGAAALAFGGVALVQAATPTPDAPAASSAAHPGWQAMREHMQERRAERAKLLHDALNLKGSQEGAWNTFQAAMQPPAGMGPGMGPGEGMRRGMGPRGAGMDRSDKQAMTTPERLDRMAERMDRMSERLAQHKAMFARRAQTVKTFYAALDPAQQRTFDAFTAKGMGGMGMMGGGRMGHGRMGHDRMDHDRMGHGPMGPGHMGPSEDAPTPDQG